MPAQLPSASVLIVEDEFVIAEMMLDVLRTAGHEHFVHVSSVDAALKVLDEGPLRGAVLDVFVNGEPVFPVADKLRELRVPFLFSSGSGEVVNLPARFHGVKALPKPWKAQDLLMVTDQVFGPAPCACD